MKLLHNLLCFAVLLVTTEAEDASKLLRGPEPNFDDAGLFPGPTDTVVDTTLIPAEGEFKPEPSVDVDADSLDEPVILSTLLNELDEDSADNPVTEVTTYDDYTSEYDRHLRSVNDPAFQGQIQLAEPRPRKEHVIPPSPHDDEKQNLRGPEPEKL
ncbi:hypothetical protein V7S43_005542 [Phytophthora oleae]|uniref:RxLR effector protein n=1 Tax=Phytophthora oleae TaxID=2107226 RepID=A0ABD3FQY3_9STRA